jgi:hypothetical protein
MNYSGMLDLNEPKTDPAAQASLRKCNWLQALFSPLNAINPCAHA